MSRYARPLCVCLLLASLAVPARVPAAVIQVDVDSYRLNGGPPVTAAWEIAERLSVAKDVAIVVMDQKATKATVQTLMKNLETLNVPTLFTKKGDYEILLKRGVIKPAPAP
ncbi:hypothetical protein [Desulfovibrio sp. TomC]|uniref:hypothetical protein n=1 Tax=Desulfovibrio sp. TomC TaxID=1562888 RepID=UPI0005747EA6|nr:hypothetical protein [Desulfovibrio sp. TomC]KHK00521.1 hypothetical protein NY78_4082 [Desulfovibrio sp. TomC]